jgi:hypothetical protein
VELLLFFPMLLTVLSYKKLVANDAWVIQRASDAEFFIHSSEFF